MVNEFVIPVLQGDIVLVVAQVFGLQRIDPLVAPQIVQLKLVLDPNLFLSGLFLLVIGGSRQSLQAALFFDPCVVDVAVLAPLRQI